MKKILKRLYSKIYQYLYMSHAVIRMKAIYKQCRRIVIKRQWNWFNNGVARNEIWTVKCGENCKDFKLVHQTGTKWYKLIQTGINWYTSLYDSFYVVMFGTSVFTVTERTNDVSIRNLVAASSLSSSFIKRCWLKENKICQKITWAKDNSANIVRLPFQIQLEV